MIPIKDNVTARRLPIVTMTIILINVAVFTLVALMSDQKQFAVLFHYGFTPAKLFRPETVQAYYWQQFGAIVPKSYSMGGILLSAFTSMFMHGGILHIVGNMWILWIFGDNVEDRLGHFLFIPFYIACGLTSSVLHTVLNPTSPVVTIGASGAIAGVMGAYMVLYPRALVLTVLPIFFFIQIFWVPAVFFLFFWFLIQIFSGVASLSQGEVLSGGVAWWAHVGGFLAGAGFILAAGMKPTRQYQRTSSGRYYPRSHRSRSGNWWYPDG